MSWDGWTKENTAEAVTRFQDGQSPGVIAAAFRIAYADRKQPSRNAIIGKLNRLGHRRHGATSPFTVAYPEGRKSAPSKVAAVRLSNPPPTMRKLPRHAATARPEPVALNPVQIMDLTAKTCRWPMSGQRCETWFCGAQPDDASSYCAGHHYQSIAGTYAVNRPGTATNANQQDYVARRYG